MKKIRKVNNNNQGIKRYLSPQPSNIRNKKQRKTVDLTDGDTERNDGGVFAYKRNTNDDEIKNKDSSSKDCLQLKATIAPNKSNENINWNTFVQDPGELYEQRYPVSFSTFKTMTHCLNVIKRILEDIRVATGIDFTNDELIKERVLKNFYIQFYEQPQIRNVYQLETKACPTFVKKKIMQIPTLSDESNRDTNANKAAKMTADKCSKGAAIQTIKHSKPVETNDNSLPAISNSDDLWAAGKPVALNLLKGQTPQNIDILNDTRLPLEQELIKSKNLNVADKPIEQECVEVQSSQSVNHCEATNVQSQLENLEAQSSKKEEISLPQQRVTPTVCRPTKKIYISKSVAFANLDFLKAHIKRRVPDEGKQQIILERIALELLQQNKYARIGNLIKQEFAVKEKSADVDENVIDITDKSSQVALVDLSQKERVQQAKALFFQVFPKTNTLPYALRFHKGLKRHIIAAILEMSMEEFKKYTRIHDAAEIYDDSELLETLYHYTIKSNQIWPQNLYMPLNDLREYLKAKGVHIADDNLEDISPMLLHWQELSEITNFDEIVRWDYYRCKGEIFDKDMDSFGIYRKTFYEKCWLYNNWLREVPKLLITVDNISKEKYGITPMEVDEDTEGAESTNKCENNQNVESEQRMNAAPEAEAVDEIVEAITHEAHTNEMDVDHAEESINTPLAVKNAEHSNETSLAQNDDACVVANQAENVAQINVVIAEPIADTSTVHRETLDDQLTPEIFCNSTLNVEISTENQHAMLRDAAAKQTPTSVALDETPSQDCKISGREIITQQRLQRAKELYFKEVEKTCTLAYLVRFHNGLKRHILQAILSMSFEEFKEYTHIYDAAEIYNDSVLLQRCYEYALKKPQVWPINLYIHLPNLFKYLQTKDITLSEADLKHISPKLLHWHELTTLTNYDYIVAWDHYRSSGKKMRKNKALREPYRQKFYTKCWFYDKWLWYTPKLSTIILSEDSMERSETVIKEESNENTVFEQSVVVHAITESERDVVESPKSKGGHDRENSAGHEHAASAIALPTNNARTVCMVDAEIQTSQRLLATLTDLQTVVPNTALRPIPEPFPLPGKAIKEEKLEPLNKLQFNLTKDEENYECVPLPDDVVDLDTSAASAQSTEQLLSPLSNSETLATQDFTSLVACESGVGRNGDKRSESPNYELNTQCNWESETLVQNAGQNEGETDEISSPPLEQEPIEGQPQTKPRRDGIVQGQNQQVELPTISPLQKPISRQVKQEIIEQQQKQADVTKERPQKALQKIQLDAAMTRIFEANLLLQKRKQKEKQQQQQRAKKLKSAAVALKKHQQLLKNNQQQQSIENDQQQHSIEDKQQQEKSIENNKQQQSTEDKQQQEKSIENNKQQQSIENDQQQQQSIEDKKQHQSIEDKQQQQQSIEDKQQQQSIEDKQQQQSIEDKKQQQSIENDQQQEKSIENNQQKQSIEKDQPQEKSIGNNQQKQSIEKDQQQEKSLGNNQQKQSKENEQQKQSLEKKPLQSVKTRNQRKSVENEQQQEKSIENNQQKQSKENEQQKQSLEKKPQQSIKTRHQRKSVENANQQEKSIENNQQEKSIENNQQEKSIENNQQEKSIENNQQEKSIKSDKSDQSKENEQQKQSLEKKSQQSVKTRHQRKSVENEQQQEKSIENNQPEKSIENNQQEKSIESGQQQEKSIENNQQKQSKENEQQKQSLEKKPQQSVKTRHQQRSIEKEQQQEKSIENIQPEKSIENIQPEKSIENNQQEKSIENNQQEKSIENNQQEKSIKSDQQQEKSIENIQPEKSIENNQQEKSIENNQQEKSIKSDQQQEKSIENNQQKQSKENEQQKQSLEKKSQQSVKTRHQRKSVENEQQQLQISTRQRQQNERQQPIQSSTLLQQQKQQMENSTLQEQQKEKELNQLADEQISKGQQQNEEENTQRSFEKTEAFTAHQQQQSSFELQSIQRKKMLAQEPSLQHIQQQQQQQQQQEQQQQQTIRKSQKTHQKSEQREQEKTGETQKIEKSQQLPVEKEGTKLNTLQQPRTQQCVQQEEKSQSHQREQTQQKQHQPTQQKHTQQAESEDLTKWLLKVTTQYQQLQHQQQESVVQQQQQQTDEKQQPIVTLEESRSQKQQKPQQQQDQTLIKQQQQQQQQHQRQHHHHHHQQQQHNHHHQQQQQQQQQRREQQQCHEQGQKQQNLFTNEHKKLQQQLQQYSHPEILLQRTSTQIQEQLVLRSSAGTLTATNLPPLNQPANRSTTTTSTATKTKTVKQARATTTTTTLRKAAKISDYVPQLTHAFQPLPIGLNTKKALSQFAASTVTSTATATATSTSTSTATATATAIDELQNQFGGQQIIPAHNLALSPTATTMAAATATATATPPVLLALPVSVSNVNNVSGGNNSFVFSLSGDNTLFNSSELFRILEGIQLQRCQHEQQLQHQQLQQQQQQQLQVQMLQLPQQIQVFDRNSSQPLVFLRPDILQQHQQQQQQQQMQLPQQLQQLQIPQLQQQQPLQQSQLQLLQQQTQLLQLQQQQGQLQQQPGQLQQQPQLLQQQFAQLQLPEQQLMPYNQTLMMERQQQQHYEPPMQISQPLALLNVDAEHQQQQQNQSYQFLSSTQQQQHVCQLVDTLQTLRCAGSEDNENTKRQQQSSEYGVQEVGITNSLQQHTHLLTENKHPLTNTTNDMLQVNICVKHTFTNTPIHSPNLVTPSLPSPKGPTRMCTPAGLKRFFCRRLEKLDYFSEVTALNIAEYQLQCSSIGQSYLQAKLRTTQLRTMVHGDIMAALLPRCTPKMIEDLQLLLQYVGEFHFDMWQQQRQRKFISKSTHRTLHTLCAHVLLLFFAYSTPFQTKCLSSVEETHCFEPGNVLSTCIAGVSANRVEQSFGELSMAVDPSILAQMAVLKRNL